MLKMPTQQLLLSWKDHNGALVSVFENLLKKNTLVDCTLAAEGQYLKAHKVVLSACSSYFELLFSQESEKNPIVILKDVTFQELEAAVNFMYRGEVEVCENRLTAFLEVADSLQIKGLGSDAKSQDSKEKASSLKCSRAKSAESQRQQTRKEDLNARSENAGQSSNVLADCEQIRNEGSSADHRLSRRRGSPTHTPQTFRLRTSCTVRKKNCRDLDPLENIEQPSLTSGESVHSEENPVIKTEPEAVISLEEQSDEAEDFGDDVTMMDDQDDWNETNTEAMDAVPTNQQGYASEHMKNDDSISENVDGMQPGNQSSQENADWIEPEEQQDYSSMIVKEEPSTSASWNQEAVEYGVSARGDVAEPTAGTSAASTGADSNVFEDNELPTPWSVQFSLPIAGSSQSDVSVEPADASWQRTSPRPPPKKFFCPSCKELFVRLIDLKRHMRSRICAALPAVLGGEQPLNDPLAPQPLRSQRADRRFVFPSKTSGIKCSECNYVTARKGDFKKHFRIHTGEKPFKCSHCDYASRRNSQMVVHLRTHTGEKPYKCPQCDYASGRSCHLLRHLRAHTGEQRFKCPHCEAKFRARVSLTRHMCTAHRL